MHLTHRFAPAPTSGTEETARHDGPDNGLEKPPAQVLLPELKERGDFMFSGATGAAVGSGRGMATEAPTYGLAKDVFEVIEKLPPELFARWAAHRPCGLLCKLSAAGMLMCDILGLPLPPFELAEPIGKAAAKLLPKIPGEQAKAKKRAERRSEDKEAAAASVLRVAVRLPIPSAGDVARAWSQLSTVAAQPPAADPPEPEPPTPESSAPEPMPAPPIPASEPTSAPAPAPVKRLFGSREAAAAICDASEVEQYMANLEEELVVGPSGPSQDPWSGSWYATHEAYLRASLEKSRVRYSESLRALKAAFPRVASCCADFEAGKCAHGKSCECGWEQAPWPWVVHVPGGRFCDCHMETRSVWVARYREYGMVCGADLWRFTKVPGPFRGDGAA